MIAYWQIALLTLYAGYQILDELTINSSAGSPIFAGFITGLIMGDLTTGLIIGGALQLTILGVGTFGGASRIDANSGTVIAAAFAIGFKMDAQLAISTIAVPVAALMVQTDVLGRFATTYFAHRIDAHVENFNYKGIERNFLYGMIPWALSRALPVFLALAFGGAFVESTIKFLVENVPWLTNGLIVAGGALPGVGFAILLHYLPIKKHLPYLIFGFVATALLTVLFSSIQVLGGTVAGLDPKFVAVFNGLPILSIAMVGFGIAGLHFKKLIATPVSMASKKSEEGEIEDDEL